MVSLVKPIKKEKSLRQAKGKVTGKRADVTTTSATVLPGYLVVFSHEVLARAASERTLWQGGNVSKRFTDATRN